MRSAASLLLLRVVDSQPDALGSVGLETGHHHGHDEVAEGVVRDEFFVHQLGSAVEELVL